MKLKKFYYNRNKKIIIALILLLCAIISLVVFDSFTFAMDNSVDEIENEISSSVDGILNEIDFSNLNELMIEIDNFNIFDNNVEDLMKKIVNGEYFTNYSSLFSVIISIVFGDIREFLPLLFTLIAIGMLTSLLHEFKSNDSASDVVYFACFGVMVIAVLFVFKDVLQVTHNTINSLLNQIKIVFPLLIAMLASIGSFSAISIYNPLVAVLSTLVSVVFEKLLYPVFIIVLLLTIMSSLTTSIKFDKIIGFLSSCFKWTIGMIFTLFAGFLSIQGISAGKFDSVSIKATKFAIKSYIPIIGSYISDGMDFLVLGSVLVKNTIGIIGVLILFLSIISPIVSILVLKLGFQLVSGVLEMTGSNKMSNFINSCSKILIYPIVIILGIAFMYVITIALIMCTANIF